MITSASRRLCGASCSTRSATLLPSSSYTPSSSLLLSSSSSFSSTSSTPDVKGMGAKFASVAFTPKRVAMVKRQRFERALYVYRRLWQRPFLEAYRDVHEAKMEQVRESKYRKRQERKAEKSDKKAAFYKDYKEREKTRVEMMDRIIDLTIEDVLDRSDDLLRYGTELLKPFDPDFLDPDAEIDAFAMLVSDPESIPDVNPVFRKDGVLHIADARVDEYAEEERKSQPLRLLERLGVPLKDELYPVKPLSIHDMPKIVEEDVPTLSRDPDDIKAQEIDREGDEVIDEWLEREHPDRVSREDWGSTNVDRKEELKNRPPAWQRQKSRLPRLAYNDVIFSRYRFKEPVDHPKKITKYKQRRVTMKIRIAAMGLPKVAEDRLRALVPNRVVNSGEYLQLCEDRYPNQFQNTVFVVQIARALIQESMKACPQYVPLSDLDTAPEDTMYLEPPPDLLILDYKPSKGFKAVAKKEEVVEVVEEEEEEIEYLEDEEKELAELQAQQGMSTRPATEEEITKVYYKLMEERNKEYAAQVEKEEEEERRSRGLIPPAKELWDMDGYILLRFYGLPAQSELERRTREVEEKMKLFA